MTVSTLRGVLDSLYDDGGADINIFIGDSSGVFKPRPVENGFLVKNIDSGRRDLVLCPVPFSRDGSEFVNLLEGSK